MGVNSMGYESAYTLLNSIVNQATGKASLTATSPADFISVGTTALQAGYDKVLAAITQIIGRTLYSVRPYNRKLSDLKRDSMEWGSIVRKLKIADVDWQDSAEFDLTDGESIDQWVVKKANILQLNFYGQNIYEIQTPSIYMDQLDAAFRGPEELNSFFSMIYTNIESQKEQKIEAVARMLLCNFIAAKISASSGVIHALTEYNTETGQELTATTVMAPSNFPAFIYWLYARMNTLARMMSERSQLFQFNVTGKVIMQHTPKERLAVKMYAPFMDAINARVKSTTFNDEYLSAATTEGVSFWQSINSPKAINTTPTYLAANGTVTTAGSAVNNSTVIGVMYDKDAIGTITQNERTMATPFNARGHYSNIFSSFTEQWFTDFTEKGIVICLD